MAIEDSSRRGQRGGILATAALFGAFVGLAMGAVVGAAVRWITGEFDLLWSGVLIGALTGPFIGGLIGFAERWLRGNLIRPDLAAIICIVFGLLPAVLVGLQGLGGVRGRLSGYLLVGAVFVGPMTGLVIGGIFDRAFEAFLKRSWTAMLPFATGIAVCVGIVCLVDAAAYGPTPEEVATKAKASIALEWKSDPDARGAKIHGVNLVRKGRSAYTGFADVTVAGQRERRPLEAVVEGGWLIVRWTTQPQEAEAR
jgi:hypothetical protein